MDFLKEVFSRRSRFVDALADEQSSLIERDRPLDASDALAKNEGQRKKTAHKWNR